MYMPGTDKGCEAPTTLARAAMIHSCRWMSLLPAQQASWSPFPSSTVHMPTQGDKVGLLPPLAYPCSCVASISTRIGFSTSNARVGWCYAYTSVCFCVQQSRLLGTSRVLPLCCYCRTLPTENNIQVGRIAILTAAEQS